MGGCSIIATHNDLLLLNRSSGHTRVDKLLGQDSYISAKKHSFIMMPCITICTYLKDLIKEASPDLLALRSSLSKLLVSRLRTFLAPSR